MAPTGNNERKTLKEEKKGNVTQETNKLLSEILLELKEIKKENENLRAELKEIREENKEMCKTTKQEITNIKSELESLKQMIATETENMDVKLLNFEKHNKQQFKGLEHRMKVLEENEERKQKQEKRNNIILKDLTKKAKEEVNAAELASNTLKEINVNKMFSEAYCIGRDKQERDIIRVKFNNFDDKMLALKNKYKLKGKEIFIDNDLTSQEREIQAAIRLKAREERDKGHEVKIGHLKMQINGKWEYWNNFLPSMEIQALESTKNQ